MTIPRRRKGHAWCGNFFGPRDWSIYKLWFCWRKDGHRVFGPQRCVGSRPLAAGNNSKCRFILRHTVTHKSSHKNKMPWALCERLSASARQHSAAHCQRDSTFPATLPVGNLGTSGLQRCPSTVCLTSVFCKTIIFAVTGLKTMS
jgi:hypothetical protein